MHKFLFTSFLALVVAVPALAKPSDVYPVPCNDLWSAVKDTLNNPGNYGVLSMNDLALKASFTVVGNLAPYTDKISLSANGGGCAMQSTFLELGNDNSDWRQFHHRLQKSLAKLQASKPNPATLEKGQM